MGVLEISSAFPTFSLNLQDNIEAANPLNYLFFSENNLGGTRLGHFWDNQFKGGTRGGFPIVFYDQYISLNDAVVFSPIDSFLESILVTSRTFDGQLAFGFNGKMRELPRGYSASSVAFLSNEGVRGAVRGWGDMLLKKYGKTRLKGDENLALRKLGYATDNGAYYYYNTIPGKNYEETMLEVLKYYNESGLSISYLQLDSWWYPKSAAPGDGGCLTWEPMASVFPHGMKILNKPLWLHSRYFSPMSPYRKNYANVVSDSSVHPCMLLLDENFYTNIMTSMWLPEEGLIVYEQDWMSTPLSRMNVTHSNYSVSDEWLELMNGGAESAHTWLQWDTAFPSEILFSVKVDRVSHGSVGPDYQPGNSQWDDGLSNMLFDAVGIKPWKDMFWTTEEQPGCPDQYSHCNGCLEPNPEMQTLLAVLSTGPVTPGDAIGHSNISLLRRTCMSDGTILKPDRPPLPSYGVFDPSFSSLDWPRVLIAESELALEDHLFKWYYVFAAKMTSSYSLTPWPDISVNQSFVNHSLVTVKLASARVVNGTKVVFFASSTEPLDIQITDLNTPLIIEQMMNSTNSSECGQTVPFDYYMMVQRQVSGWAVLGELDKFVPANKQRIVSMESGDVGNDIVVKINGPPGETVTLSFIPPGPIKHISIGCTFPTNNQFIRNGEFASMTVYCQYTVCRCLE